MSVIALGDLVFGDLLTEHNLKPVWEKFRGYIFTVTAACALSLLYFGITGMHIDCLPVFNDQTAVNNSGSLGLSIVETALVNTYCTTKLPFYYTYCGALCIGMTVAILIASMYWLHIPDVAGSFSTLGEVEKIISSLDMTLQDLKDSAIEPIGDNLPEKHLKVRKTCMMLWGNKRKINIRSQYIVRCAVLETGILNFLAFSIWILVLLGNHIGKTFACTLDDPKKLGIDEGIKTCTCVSAVTGRLFGFLLVFTLSLAAQFVVIAWGTKLYLGADFREALTSLRNVCYELIYKKGQVVPAKETVDFMKTFWKYSRPVQSSIVAKFIHYIFSSECREKMMLNIKRALQTRDVQLIVAYIELDISPLSAMCTVVRKVSAEKEKNWPDLERYLIKTLRELDYELDECKEFVTIALEKRMFGLVAAALDYSKYKAKETDQTGSDTTRLLPDVQWVKDLNLNLDEISLLPTGKQSTLRGSLLYYALASELREVNKKYTAANLLLANTVGNPIYVHFCGRSMTLNQFVNSRQIDTDVLKIPGNPTESSSQSNEQLKALKQKYIDGTGHFDAAICRKIAGLKFSKWEPWTNALAERANEKNMWVVLVPLLNAFIVTDEERERIAGLPDCQAISFERVPWPEIFEHSMFKTEDDGTPIFIPTAARQILFWCTSQQKHDFLNAVFPNLDMSAPDLSETDKEYLRKLAQHPCQTPQSNRGSEEGTSGS